MTEKTIFINFQEYYTLTRSLNKFQKDILFSTLSSQEQEYLSQCYKEDGWEDLFIINEIDIILDSIKETFDIDLIYIRIRVLSGDIQKVNRTFWDNILSIFSSYAMRHIWHIFEGIKTVNLDKNFVLLIPSKRSLNGKRKEQN